MLLVGQFVNAAGALAWIYLTLYLVDARHLSGAHAGLLTAANGAGIIFGNLVGGGVGDRIGLRRALLLGLVGWAITCLLVPVAPVTVLVVLLPVAGTLGGFARPLMSAVTLNALPTDQRRAGAALWRAAFNAGAIVGPPLGALAAAHDFGVIFAADSATSIVLALLVARCAPKDGHRTPRRDRVRGPSVVATLRHRPFAVAVLVTVILVDTSYRQLYVGLPLELRHLRAPTLVYGLTITINCVLIVLAEVWVALRMANRKPGVVIVAGYALVGVSWLVFGTYPSVVTAFGLVVLISAGEMLYKPTATAAIADAAPTGFEGRYQSLYAAASVSGTVIAPAVGGVLFEHHPGALWMGAAALPLLAAAALWRVPGRPERRTARRNARDHASR